MNYDCGTYAYMLLTPHLTDPNRFAMFIKRFIAKLSSTFSAFISYWSKIVACVAVTHAENFPLTSWQKFRPLYLMNNMLCRLCFNQTGY